MSAYERGYSLLQAYYLWDELVLSNKNKTGSVSYPGRMSQISVSVIHSVLLFCYKQMTYQFFV